MQTDDVGWSKPVESGGTVGFRMIDLYPRQSLGIIAGTESLNFILAFSQTFLYDC